MTASGAPCLFCRIARGEEHASVVLDAPEVVAFLDHRPLFPGHCLLVPRRHVSTLGDAPDDVLGPLFSSARLLAVAVEAAMGAEGTFVALNNRVSQSVPHLHVHVVPRRRKDGLRGFFWPRQKYEGPEQQLRAFEAIAAEVRRLEALASKGWPFGR